MDKRSKQERYTGSSPLIDPESASGKVQPGSTERLKESQVSTGAPSAVGSKNSTGEALGSELLALLVMMGDFKALKKEIPESWQATSNGKIYWCASMDGHSLDISKSGNLLVDGTPANDLLNILVDKSTGEKKNTGGKK